jgi:HEAT repeat protein
MIKVFLSSTSKDLVEFRQRAEKAISGLDGYHCIAMENFGARDATAAEYCPDLVAECDLVVLLIGPTYGSCPAGATTSFTEQEWEKAVELDKPRLAFASSKHFNVPQELLLSLAPNTFQQAKDFRGRVGAERIWGEFATPGDLDALISRAIPNWQKQYEREQKDRARVAYLDHLIERNTDLYPRGVMQTVRQVSLRLDEVYVSLKAERELRGRERGRQVVLWDEATFDEDVWQGPGGRRGLVPLDDAPRKEEAELYDAVRGHARIVVLGDPGAGKTTLLRFLALQFAQAYKSGQPTVIDKEGRAYGETRLPVFLRVADFADAFAKNKNLKLRNFLAVPFGDVQAASEALQAVLFDALQQGRALLLLDGLDEVIDAGDRAQIAGEIESFVAALHSNIRVIVTSRITGYREAALGGDYQHFTLLDLERPQIERFLTRWCQAQERFLSRDASEAEVTRKAQLESAAILQAVDENPGVQRLAVNPLLLTILALIHKNGARLPNRRIELYDLAAKTLLEDWQLARGVPSGKTIKEHEAAQFLWPLAHWLHREKPRGMATEAEIKQQLAKFLAAKRKLATDDPEIIEAVNDFLHRVRHHTGVLVERAPKQYGFMHLTFEEYFAARELVRRPDQLAQKIYELRHQPRWQEPILLAIGYVSEHFPDLPSELIRTAILAEGEVAAEYGYQPSLYEDVLHRDLLLAAQCVADCATIEPDFRRSVMQHLAALYFDPLGCGTFMSLQEKVEKIFGYFKDTEALREAADVALAKITAPEERTRKQAIYALADLKLGSSDVVTGLITASQDSDDQVCMQAILALGKLQSGVLEAEIALLTALKSDNAWMRISAARALCIAKIETPRIIAGLFDALNDENWDVYRRAAWALSEVANPAIISGLFKVFYGQEHGRREIVLALSNVADSIVRERLLVALTDSNESIRSNVALALGWTRNAVSEVITSLLEALRDKSEVVRANAAEALGVLRSPDAVEGLLVSLRDNNEEVRRRTAMSLGDLGVATPEVVIELRRALRDKVTIRIQAAEALGKLKVANSEVVSDLLTLLNRRDGWSERYAAEALGKIGTQEAIDGLLAARRSQDSVLRKNAEYGVGQLRENSPLVIAALLELLRDENTWFCGIVAKALGQIACVNSEIAVALLDRLHHGSAETRSDVAEAWGKLAATKQAALSSAILEKAAEEIRTSLFYEDSAGRGTYDANGRIFSITYGKTWDALWLVCQRLSEQRD